MTALDPAPAIRPCPPTLAGTDPLVVRDEILGFVRRAITNRPRDLQREIGPSGLGHPCDRHIGYVLAGKKPVGYQRAPWRQTVGTCVDDGFKQWADAANDQPWHDSVAAFTDLTGARDEQAVQRFLDSLDQADADGGRRWWTDLTSLVGELYDGRWVTGTLDLYDAATAGVIDLKTPGRTQMRKHKAGQQITDEQYRKQVFAYGRGLRRLGWPVEWVAILRLPAAGELDEATWQWEPYTDQVADQTLAHVGAIARLVDALGDGAARALPTADHYCRRCPFRRDDATDPADACPGHPGFDRGNEPGPRNQPPAAMQALIGPNPK